MKLIRDVGSMFSKGVPAGSEAIAALQSALFSEGRQREAARNGASVFGPPR